MTDSTKFRLLSDLVSGHVHGSEAFTLEITMKGLTIAFYDWLLCSHPVALVLTLDLCYVSRAGPFWLKNETG